MEDEQKNSEALALKELVSVLEQRAEENATEATTYYERCRDLEAEIRTLRRALMDLELRRRTAFRALQCTESTAWVRKAIAVLDTESTDI